MEIAVLLVLAVLCLLLELFLPGGVIGAFGALLALGGVIMAGMQYGWGYAAGLFVACGITSLAILAIAFRLIPRSRLGTGLVLDTEIKQSDGYVAQDASLSALEGKEGIVRSNLRPAGVAQIEGQRFDVISEGGYIESGAKVRVVAAKGNRVVVRRV